MRPLATSAFAHSNNHHHIHAYYNLTAKPQNASQIHLSILDSSVHRDSRRAQLPPQPFRTTLISRSTSPCHHPAIRWSPSRLRNHRLYIHPTFSRQYEQKCCGCISSLPLPTSFSGVRPDSSWGIELWERSGWPMGASDRPCSLPGIAGAACSQREIPEA